MPDADLVLEGGGVKGLGTAGAVMALLDAGYRFQRLAGTSVGAVAAAFAAAGVDSGTFRAVLGELDLRRVPDGDGLPVVGEGLGLLVHSGAYRGDWIHQWLRSELANLGVHTFGDLRRDDPGDDPAFTDAQRYRLVVMATDVTHGRLLRLPWDYDTFGLPRDEQPVADAVRMSLSIPFYFRPCTLTDAGSGLTSTVVDGGVLSNFPIEIFDRTDDRPSRWPTFGVRLMPDLPEGLGQVIPLLGLPTLPVIRLLEQVVTTALVGNDQTHLDEPGVRDRTMTVDTSGVAITDFGIGDDERRRLIEEGARTAREFLAAWTAAHP